MFALLLAAALCAPIPQGSDDCAAAQPIAGFGTFAFDSTAATQDGSGTVCGMTTDVWFRWTAPSTEAVAFETCGLTSVDTVLAVFPGSAPCPPSGSPIVCGDDTAGCGRQTRVAFVVDAGEDYLVRLGSSNFLPAGGTGSLEIGPACDVVRPGPNVVAGDIASPSVWGTVGSTSAYAFSTTACNLGTDELLWIADTPEHPVVAHNLYRLEDGRFEQVGMSWAKHGFAALQAALCCTCLPAASTQSLGVGCSDPYSASTNAWQPSLGPRAEVDAAAGTIAWPIGSQVTVPAVASVLDRRLQVANADVDPALHPGARWFVEAVYATADDAVAGNAVDNASYREVSVVGTTSTGAAQMQAIGVTERGAPAVFAWAAAQPTVRIEAVDVPGDGRLWVASDATDLGGGAWRYDVCVFNLSSHRGVAALEAAAGLSPRAASMTFPRAHSGEPRSNDPWPAAFTAGTARWEAPGAAVDPNANAILWGTMDSFSWECDTPPSDGVVRLELFRGTGAAFVEVPARVPGALPAQRYCAAEVNSAGRTSALLPGSYQPLASLELVALGLPPLAIGMVVTSRTQGFVAMPGGSEGNLCLGGAIGRSVGALTAQADLGGRLAVTADLGALPQATAYVAVQPGETWYFQAWHRDGGGATSNFSEGLALTF